jgi:hypothetical protein
VLLARFESRVIRNEEGCWGWKGRPDTDGYGRTHVAGKYWKAHRLSYRLFVGPLAEEELVCHTCDNPICPNPAHLFKGANQDNMADMVRKGRSLRGERQPKVRLTRWDVQTIRLLQAYGLGPSLISHICGEPLGTVSNVLYGHAWGWLPGVV